MNNHSDLGEEIRVNCFSILALPAIMWIKFWGFIFDLRTNFYDHNGDEI